MQTHNLNIYDEYWHKILSREKKCEIRKFTRDYKIGDILRLKNKSTGEILECLVTDIAPTGNFGIPEDLAIMSIDITKMPAGYF